MTFRTTWSAPEPVLREAELVLTELIDPPVDAASLVRDDDASDEPENASWLLHVYTEEPLSDGPLGKLPSAVGRPRVEQLEDKDWVAHALEGLGIVRAGPFVVFGSHDAEKLQSDEGIKIQVEANQAFGTGHHPTTAGCLNALSELTNRKFTRILDLGTGSGVLAFGARKLWPQSLVLASDIDETSVQIAKENAAINSIDDVRWIVAHGTDDAEIAAAAPYDLVMANILAGPLVELAPDVVRLLSPNGVVILAGLLDEQEQSVRTAYTDLGLSLIHKGGTDRWPTLTLEKGV